MSMAFYDHRTPVSRKERVCEMCGQKIMPGERYSREVGKYYGDFFERDLHTECFDVLSSFIEEVDNEFCWDQISDWWQETRCEKCKHYYKPCVPGSCYDDSCEEGFQPQKCDYYRDGKCTDDTCDEKTRVCWCDKFEEE